MQSTKYRNITQPWVVVPLPNSMVQVLQRFQRRNVAEHYVQVMKRLRPNLKLEIVWFQILEED